MNAALPRSALAFALCSLASSAVATSWTYRGTLDDGGKPANGAYDLRIRLLDETRHVSIGSPVTMHAVDVRDGQFAVDVDFGVDLANAPPLSLQTEVQQGSSGFVALGAPTRFDPNAALAGVCWDTEGNAGTNPATNFIGTTDNQPLVLRTFNTNTVQIIPIVSTSPPGPTLLAANFIVGSFNNVSPGLAGATIGGGGSNPIPNNPYTTFTGFLARGNSVTSDFATVAGGYDNEAGVTPNNHLGRFSTVSGGVANRASGGGAAVSGGSRNTANGAGSAIPGGFLNCAGGSHSLAAGRRAKIRPPNDPGGNVSLDACAGLAPYPGGSGDQGTFVWADSQDANFVSTGANQFLIRANGGLAVGMAPFNANTELTVRGQVSASAGQQADIALVPNDGTGDEGILITAINGGAGANDVGLRIAHATPTSINERMLLAASGAVTIRSNITVGNTGVTMAANGGSWTSLSDRNVKTAFAAVDALAILARVVEMPVSTWSYIAQGDGIRHIGPTAQDFRAAFGVGETDTGITTIDADGVALAAIQGLNQKLEADNAELRASNASAEAALADLRTRMAAIEARLEVAR